MEKEFNIKIGGIKESISNLESLEEALSSIERKTENINKNGGFSVASKEGNKAMDELAKLTQKITQYDEEYARAVEASKGVLKDKNKAIKDEIDLEKANITVQENVSKTYYDKQKLLSALGKQIKSMTTDTEDQKRKQDELIQQYNTLNQELKEFDATMGNHQRNVGDYRGALKEATTELKNLKGQMVGVEQGTAQWDELAKQAGAYADKIGDINAAIKRQASDTKHLDDVINLAKSATAAFTLWKGAMSAFGMETEAAEEAIQKLAGAMSIIQSLQTLSDTLQASSASATLFNKAIKLTGVELITTQAASIKATVAQEGLTKAQKVGTIATKTFSLALKAIPFMLVIGLIASLITHWKDIVGWIDKTFPALKRCGGAMNSLKAVVVGLGQAVLHWLINPWKTFAEVIKKVMSGDFKGAIAAAVEGAKKQFTGLGDAFKKGFQNQVERGLEEISNKRREVELKDTEYQLQMLQARQGNDAKYSKAGIELQKKVLAQRKALAKGNKDELNKIALDEANFYRECQEKKAAAAKKSAEERKKAEKEAAAEAKRLAAEAEKKRKEEEKAAEEARKKELEAAKELNDAKKTGANLEIDYQKAVLNEKKRVVGESISADDKEMKSLNDKMKLLQNIVNNENFSKKTRREAAEQLEKAEARLMRIEEDRKNLLDKQIELEKEIVRLNKEKSENGVFEELKQNLSALTMTKEEFYSLIDGTSDKLTGYTETQLQYVKNAAMQMKTITQEAATSIEDIISKVNEKKNSGSSSGGSTTGGGDKGSKKKKLWHGKGDTKSDGSEYNLADNLAELFTNLDEMVFAPAMDTFSMFMDFAIEETQQKLEEVENLHDKALDKVEESADKIRELNEKLRDSNNTNKQATAEQLADEQLLYAQRVAEEKKLAEQEKALKNKQAQQEAKARKMELGYQMVMAIANTAQGASKALATWGWPLGAVFAGVMAALGAVQVGLIAAQMSKIKPVKYAEGGIIEGRSHAQGGERIGNTNIEVEGGEMVVSKKNSERYKDVLYKINRNDPSVRYLQSNKGAYVDTKIRKYADGGTLNFQAADENLRANSATNRLMSAIEGIDMQPVVAVTDIERVQSRLVRVRGLAGRS